MEEDKSSPVVTEQDTPATPEAVPSDGTPVNTSNTSIPSPRKRKFGTGVIVAVIIAVLFVASAAAYLGIIVPNRPENVLKKAFANTAEQRKSKVTGKFTYENLDPAEELKAVNVEFSGQSDMDNKAFQSEFAVIASGFRVPFELRGIEKSIFFKVGDLSGIKSLVQLTNPEYVPAVDFFNQKLANQWMEIDETLLKQMGTECILDISAFSLTKEDVEIIEKRYDEVSFATIKSTSDDTVNNHSATKFELEIDNDKADEFGKGLDDLSVVKKIRECSESAETFNSDELTEVSKSQLTVWVDKKSKTISKISSQSTKESEEKEKVKGSIEMTLEYGEADIRKPEGARPITEVMGELYSALLQGADPNSPLLQNPIPTSELEL